jgi:hypothetical protein
MLPFATTVQYNLTRTSDAVWKGTITLPEPARAYDLALGFQPLLRSPWIPWHPEHHTCEERGRRNPRTVPSFVPIILHQEARPMVPIESAIIRGCAMCALLRKVANYLVIQDRKHAFGTLGLFVKKEDKRLTTFIDFDHGLYAEELLTEFLQSVEVGDVVKMKVYS